MEVSASCSHLAANWTPRNPQLRAMGAVPLWRRATNRRRASRFRVESVRPRSRWESSQQHEGTAIERVGHRCGVAGCAGWIPVDRPMHRRNFWARSSRPFGVDTACSSHTIATVGRVEIATQSDRGIECPRLEWQVKSRGNVASPSLPPDERPRLPALQRSMMTRYEIILTFRLAGMISAVLTCITLAVTTSHALLSMTFGAVALIILIACGVVISRDS